jgi:DNA topoisomerase-2
MIMADQDHDGSHIKGLLINFLHFYWPSLLKIEGFLQQFITPIVKCSKGKSTEVFFTIPQYEAWKEKYNAKNQWKIKYYKGLGTSTSAEAKEYFSNLDIHQIDFHWNQQTDNVLDLAFAKKRCDDRKDWLLSMEHGTFIDYNVKSVAYDTFVNRELILFSHADNSRSIPHFMDGMKPSQRKVLFSCFKKKLTQELKVAQLAGYISEKSCYHHGEASLTQTIISMAQNFVGSNNINLLSPCGQFGTRAQGGKDAASPRYVYTKLEPITRCIFHPDDDALLKYLHEDGISIEPEFYAPIIPMLLVNGSEGIGTGWSTSVPTYNPREIISNLRRILNGEDIVEMHPWYRGFIGEIKAKSGRDTGNYLMYGNIDQENESTFIISELPIGKWTNDYKQMLESMVIGGPGAAEGGTAIPIIKDFKENHTDTTVLFTLSLPPEKVAECMAEKGGMVKKFKLESSIATTNMNVFDLNNQIRKFER